MNRTRLAAGGAVALAIIGAVLAMLAVAQPTAKAGASTRAGIGAATATATKPPSTTTPTRVLVPTDTPPPVRQPTTIRGTIANTPANATFQLSHNGTTITVVVNGQTTYQGAASSFSGLQQGMFAHVTGVYQTDGTFLAANVDSSPPDN